MPRRAAFHEAFACQHLAGLKAGAVQKQPIPDGCVGLLGDGFVDVVADHMQRIAVCFDHADRGRFGKLINADLLGKERLPAEGFKGGARTLGRFVGRWK